VEVTSPLTFAIATFGKTFDKNQKYYFLKFSFHGRNIAQTQVRMKDVSKSFGRSDSTIFTPIHLSDFGSYCCTLGHDLTRPAQSLASVFSSYFNMHVGFTNIATP
jgi:hypothetical protein